MNLILNYLLFFPSVTFGVISAEIFPWALVFVVVYLRRLDWATMGLILALVLSSLYTAIFALSQTVPVETDVLRSLATYLNIILIFKCILSLPQGQSDKLMLVARKIFIGLLFLGGLQYFSFLSGINDILQLIVPRAQGSALTEMGGRGVTLLSSEPARAGLELTFLYMLVRINQNNKPWSVLGDILFLLYIVAIIKSASAAAFALFVIGLVTGQRPVNILIGALLIVMGLALSNIELTGRFVILVTALQDFGTVRDILFFIANESGQRLIALYSFVLAGLNNPLGFGVGFWREASVMAIEASGVDYTQFRYFQLWGNGHAIAVRAPGVLPNLMLDIGLIGVLYFCYWIYRLSCGKAKSSKAKKIILLVLFVKITFFGSPGNPIPWVVTALLLRSNSQTMSTRRLSAGRTVQITTQQKDI